MRQARVETIDRAVVDAVGAIRARTTTTSPRATVRRAIVRRAIVTGTMANRAIVRPKVAKPVQRNKVAVGDEVVAVEIRTSR